MRELEPKYEGRLDVSVLEATSPEGLAAKEKYGWEKALHGLVTLTPDGEMIGNLPSHNYGRPAIEQKIEELLEKTGR